MNQFESELVSIIMPVFNSAEYLGEAIESILFQTYSNFELIIIYDDSEDCSLAIINDYCSRDSRIKCFEGSREGIIGALNIGMQKSQGKFIARMDSDDICDRERLEKQVYLLEHNNLDICGGHSLLMDKLGRTMGISLSPLGHEACTLCLSFMVPFIHPTAMFKKSFMQDHNLSYGQSSYKGAEDYDLWVRMHEAGALFGNVDAVLINYRVLENSISRNNALMLSDSKALSNQCFHKNYDYCLEKLAFMCEFGSASEKSLAVRFIWRGIFKKGNFLAIKNFKFVEIKTLVNTTLSEIMRTLRFKGL